MGAARRVWLANIVRSGKIIDAVQTMRNWILASSLLCTAAVTLMIGVPAFFNYLEILHPQFVNPEGPGIKIVAILICSIIAFFCFAQSIRYFNHTVIAINCKVEDEYWDTLEGIEVFHTFVITINHAGTLLNRGCMFFTLGLRFFYLSFPLLTFLFGPWLLLTTSIVLVIVLGMTDFTMSLKHDRTSRIQPDKKTTAENGDVELAIINHMNLE